jgi:hypothetical protein
MTDQPSDYCVHGHYEEGNPDLPRCSNEIADSEAQRDADEILSEYRAARDSLAATRAGIARPTDNDPWTPDAADEREIAGAYHSMARRGANAMRHDALWNAAGLPAQLPGINPSEWTSEAIAGYYSDPNA